jgi:beta-lactam-binding protein with PASTA domain
MYYESGAKYFWISFITALIVSSIMSFVFIMFVSPYISQRKTRVEVPNVKGMSQEQASLVLKNKGLLHMISQRKNDPNYENDVILDQDPLPGFSVEEGSIVKLTVNEKTPVETPQNVIPDVRGVPLMTAKSKIEKMGYVVGKIEFQQSDTYAKDNVINTDPSPGTESEQGTKVNIIVSTGQSEIVVPNLYRKSVSSARALLQKSNLKLGQVRYTTNIEFPFDIIISQDPTSGTKIKSGSSVDIVVNREGIY